MLSEYFEAGGSFCTTCPCALEVFSVLKVKHFYRKELTREECVFASHAFSAHLRDQLKVEPCGFHGASLFFEVEALARRHNLDIVDGIQMHALLRGRFSHFAGSHKNLLIIADEELAAAARAEGIDVWDCMHEPGPTHWGPTTREPTVASGLRRLAVPSALRASAAAQRERWASWRPAVYCVV